MTRDVEALIARLRERAASYRQSGPSAEHTASLLAEAADALAALLAERNALIAERVADLRALLTALGLGAHARAHPPAEVFKGCLREIARLREASQC